MDYFAFISYSRYDKKIARYLHHKLENYPYPQDLIVKEDRPNHSKYLRKIFIDISDLPVTQHSFTEDIKTAIENSKFLIVICSKSSCTSIYVTKEIEFFLKTHNNDSSLIIPLILDNIKDAIPEILIKHDALSRNLPIFSTNLDFNSESNKCCFYHLVAYLLRVDFSILYNRYELYAKKKRHKKTTSIIIFIALLLCTIIFLGSSLKNQIKYNQIQREFTLFEKSIFPLSIVFGYEQNFLAPTIEYFKENKENSIILILMPNNINDLAHQKRFSETLSYLKTTLKSDSLSRIILPTRMKRRTTLTKVHGIKTQYDNVYIDFASTTSTFKRIIDYKKGNELYKNSNPNEMMKDYTNTFIHQAKHLLKEDSCYIKFFTNREELVNYINVH